MKVFLVLLLLQIQININSAISLKEAIMHVNREQLIDINIFVNLGLNWKNSPMDIGYNEILYTSNREIPALLVSNLEYVKRLKGSFSEHSLTVAWINWENMNETFTAIDKLLYERHFTNIIFVYQVHKNQSEELLLISQLCWKFGLTSIMIWIDYMLCTYHPYPSILVHQINNISHFSDKSHLDNLQQYEFDQPTVEFPPRFYSYTNRNGQTVYSGYLHHIIYLFLSRHNASVRYFFYDMWDSEVSQKGELLRCLGVKPCALLPLLFSHDDLTLASSSPFLYKLLFLVPSAQEISQHLYLGLPFDTSVWIIVLSTGVLYFGLISILNVRRKSFNDWGLAFLEAYKIIMFLPVISSNRRTCLNFFLNILFLFTGIFLTNYYSTSLWSMYTIKIYEPELKLLTDVERTSLKIFVYKLDLVFLERLTTLPSFIPQRYHLGNESELLLYRENLNMTYIYPVSEDLVDYLLLKQTYLKRPIARTLSEVFWNRPFFLHLMPRSPIFLQFNRYLFRIFESGIFKKFLKDSYWEGLVSGKLQLLQDTQGNAEGLTLAYFQYAFVALLVGWIAASAVFLMEIVCYRNYIMGRKIKPIVRLPLLKSKNMF